MQQTIEAEIPAAEVARIRGEIRGYLAEMQRANERIKTDQREIERLKAKTRATLTAIEAMRSN